MAASIFTVLFFLLVGILFPHKPKPVKNYDMLILVNEHKYKIYELLTLVPLFLFTGIICYFFSLIGNDIQELYYRGRVSEFSIYPPESFWLVPGVFFGFGLIISPTEIFFRLLLKDEYDVFMEYSNRKYGFDGYKVMRIMCTLSIITGLVLSYLGLGWYKEIKNDRIIIDEFSSLAPQEYRYDQIENITHYTKTVNAEGVVRAEPHYKITFYDGKVWNTSDNFHEVNEEKYEAIIRYLLSKSNLELILKDTD